MMAIQDKDGKWIALDPSVPNSTMLVAIDIDMYRDLQERYNSLLDENESYTDLLDKHGIDYKKEIDIDLIEENKRLKEYIAQLEAKNGKQEF